MGAFTTVPPLRLDQVPVSIQALRVLLRSDIEMEIGVVNNIAWRIGFKVADSDMGFMATFVGELEDPHKFALQIEEKFK